MAGERKSFAQVGGRIMRLTRLDGCGRPAWGDRARLVTEGFISVTATAQIRTVDAISVTNANGKECIRRGAKSYHDGWSIEAEFCGVIPDVVEFLTGNPAVTNGRGDIAGIQQNMDVDGSIIGAAMEIWGDLGEGDACAPSDVDASLAYTLFPFLQGGTIGDFTIENDAVTFTVSNAISRKGTPWGTGPYLVDVDENGDPMALDVALPDDNGLLELMVGLNPPEETAGAIPLDDPDSEAATTAVAGTPGHFTPTGAQRPETLAEMAGITASPTTAWTTGQGVMMQSGDMAHWNATAWVAGVA